MSDVYIELLVKKKQKTTDLLLRYFVTGLTIASALAGVFLYQPFALLAALVFGVITYFVHLNTNLEFEYLYLDKEITIDKVMAKTKRKRIAAFGLERMEIIAPINSHQLDSYKNRQGKVQDFSSGEAKQPEERYMMIYDGGKKVILEPNEAMLKAMRSIAPRKVFMD